MHFIKKLLLNKPLCRWVTLVMSPGMRGWPVTILGLRSRPANSNDLLGPVGPGPGQESVRRAGLRKIFAGQAGPGQKIAGLSRPVPCPYLLIT